MPTRPLDLHLVFRDLDRNLENATFLVHVEDASEADAPARWLSTQRFTGVSVTREDPLIHLALDLPDLARTRASSIRVHVITDGDPAIRPGHFINTTEARVPDAKTETVRIELSQVL
jgi:hypothetical protein